MILINIMTGTGKISGDRLVLIFLLVLVFASSPMALSADPVHGKATVPNFDTNKFCSQLYESAKSEHMESYEFDGKMEPIKSLCLKNEIVARNELAQMDVSPKLMGLCLKMTRIQSYGVLIYCVEALKNSEELILTENGKNENKIDVSISGLDIESYCKDSFDNSVSPEFIESCIQSEIKARNMLKSKKYSKSAVEICTQLSQFSPPGSYGIIAYCLSNFEELR